MVRRLMSGTLSEEEPSLSRMTIPEQQQYRIQTAILLNRSPILTHPPTSFETAYYEYNAHIARALFNPFPKDFYFKPGSILEKQFKREDRRREKEAFNWGKRPGSQKRSSERKAQRKKSSSPIGLIGKEEEDVLLPRRTEADEKGDVKSLDRKGHRNLYLLIKKNKGRNDWRLPGGSLELQGQELLHEVTVSYALVNFMSHFVIQIAQRELNAECGLNLDAWIVGRHPIGFMEDQLPLDTNISALFTGCKVSPTKRSD